MWRSTVSLAVAACATSLLVANSDRAAAQQCNQLAIASNTEAIETDARRFVARTRHVTSQSRQSSDSSAGMTIGDTDLTWGEAEAISNKYEEVSGQVLNSDQATSVLRSTVSADSVDAYKACLDQDRLTVYFNTQNALNDSVIPIIVKWNPNYPVDGKRKLNFQFSDGGKLQSVENLLIQPQTVMNLAVVRSSSGPLTFTVSVDGSSAYDIISFPGTKQHKIDHRTLRQPNNFTLRNGQEQTFCIDAGNDGVLLANSMHFEGKAIGFSRDITGGGKNGPITLPRFERTLGNNSRVCARVEVQRCSACSITGVFAVTEAFIGPAR